MPAAARLRVPTLVAVLRTIRAFVPAGKLTVAAEDVGPYRLFDFPFEPISRRLQSLIPNSTTFPLLHVA